MNAPAARAGSIDFEAVKSRQQAAWTSGDYSVIGVTLQIVGETLCEAVDLRSTYRVLDVAAGNGNASLAAARRFCDVVSTDYVPGLLERAKERSAADRLPIVFQMADVENLPFPAESFDAVLSTFGVMFAPNHGRSASEMLRVLRRGGKIGMANWTPESFVGQIFKTMGQYLPPAAGMKSPALWGTEPHLQGLFGENAAMMVKRKHFVFRYKSPKHWLEIFKAFYGPVLKAFSALDASIQSALETDLLALAGRFNIAADGTLVAPSEYLEIVLTKK
jgi:ubiquinone/menaquinone biosynthesis C-methylase UbiE